MLLNYTGGGGGGGGSEISTFAATTVALTATYANGTSGIGATLTNAGALAAFSIDGVSPSVGARVLIKNQASTFQNGVYTVTTAGSGAVAWVLTRASDFDQSSEIVQGDFVLVSSGATQAGTIWYLNSASNPVIGTDAITFAQSGVGSFVTSSAVIADDVLVRGDGGARGVQGSVITLSDAGVLGAIGGAMFPSTSSGIMLYNTVDQVTNFERMTFSWSGNIAVISSENAGSGSPRTIRLARGTTRIDLAGTVSASGQMQFATGTTGGVDAASIVHTYSSNATSGVYKGYNLSGTYNQTGTAGSTDLFINRTNTALGSGVHNFIDMQVGGSTVARINTSGNIYANQLAYNSASVGGQIQMNASGATTGVINMDTNGASSMAASSGTETFHNVAFTVNQSGTAAYRGLRIVATENSVGSGTSLLIQALQGASTRFSVQNNGAGVFGSSVTIAASSAFIHTGRSRLSSPSDGTYLMQNNAATDFTMLELGGTTSSFPAIKRNGTGIDIRLADDSAFAPLAASTLSVSSGTVMITSTAAFTNGAAAQAGTLTNAPSAGNPTKWIPINDNGTTRYIPAW